MCIRDSYASASRDRLPPYSTRTPSGFPASWRYTILPFIEESSAQSVVSAQREKSSQDPFVEIRKHSISVFECPSSPGFGAPYVSERRSTPEQPFVVGRQDYTASAGVVIREDGSQEKTWFAGAFSTARSITQPGKGSELKGARLNRITDGLSLIHI